LAAEVDEPAVEAVVAQVDEVGAGLDDEDSDEFSFDIEDVDEESSVSSMETLVDKPVEASPAVEPQAVPIGDSEDSDSSEFGLGLFDDEVSDDESVEVASESSDDDSESSVVVPGVATAAAVVGAGVVATGLAGAGTVDAAELDRQWEAKLSILEDQNAKLNSQVETLTKQLEEASKVSAQADSLQQKHGVLADTVKSLGLEKDQLLQDKELADKEKCRLAEELEAAQKNSSAWEQEKADLLKQQEELQAEKEANDSQLESLAAQGEQSASELATLQAEIETMTQQRSEFESEIEALQAKLAEAEVAPAENASGEEIEDLKKRFKRRLAAEYRKRKEAEYLVGEAEAQRNEVAKLLRAAKAELKEIKA